MDRLAGLVPPWVAWTPIAVYVLVSALVSWAACFTATAAAALPLRKAAHAHWTERARLAHPARVIAAAFALVIPLVAGGHAAMTVGPLAALPPPSVGVLCAAASFAAALAVRFQRERALRPSVVTWHRWATGAVALTLIRMPHLALTGVVMAATWFIHPDATAPMIALMLGSATLLLAVALGAGAWLALLLGVVRPAGPRLLAVSRAQAARAGAAAPRVFEVPVPAANAFALPARQWIVVTDQALADLDDDELGAVLAHELGHLTEGPGTLAARMAPMVAFFVVAFVRPIYLHCGFAGIAAASLAALASLALAHRVGRRMEERADRAGAAGQPIQGTFAHALEKLYRSSLLPAVAPGRRPLHPHLYDRMIAAGIQPDYPRPAPPSGSARWSGVIAGVSVALALSFGFDTLVRMATPCCDESEAALLCSIALCGGSGPQLGQLARRQWRRGDDDTAVALFDAAADREPSDGSYLAGAALVLASQGDCEAAEAELLAANRLGSRSRRSADYQRAWQAVETCRVRRGPRLEDDP